MAITTWSATTGNWDDSKFSRGWNGPSIAPAKGDLTTSSSIPFSSIGSIISPSYGTTQFATNYSWEGYASSVTWATTTDTWNDPSDNLTIPAVSIGTNIVPASKGIAFSTSVPRLDIMRLTYVPSASMTTTLSIPYAVAGHFALIDAGSLNINPDKIIWNNYVGDWDSATEAWDSFVDTRPSVDQTFSFDPTTGALILAGQQVDPQHRAPKFLPPIQII